jgi:thiol-disulfide isomerase/thioredoxin
MKQTIVLLICLTTCILTTFAQQKIIITGQLSGVKEGTPISLMKVEGSVGSEVAKDSVRNGQFRIEYTPQNESTENYSLSSYNSGFPSIGLKLWAKAGKTIKIKGENNLLYTWEVTSDIPEQKEWSYFVRSNKDSWNAFQQLSIQRNAIIEKYFDSEAVSKEEKAAARKMIDSIDKASDTYQYKIYKNNLSLLEKASITPVKLELLNDVANMIKWNNIEEFRDPVLKLYQGLNPDLKNSTHGEMIALTLFPPKVVKVGEPMYDTLLTDLNGKPHYLADFKGKFILLDFWSFGCGPCHASVPEMKEISAALKDSLAVVSLTSDNKEMWKKASDYFKMTWNNLSDGKETRGIYAKYGVEGIPNYVLISPDGIVKDSWMGYSKGSLKAKIKEQTGLTIEETGN